MRSLSVFLCVLLCVTLGCGSAAKQPYEPPDDLPTEMVDGEDKLPEDSGP